MENYVFPYEMIPYGAKVAIYGAGNVGNEYIRQILGNKYCDIVCVADKNYCNLVSCKIRLCAPYELQHFVFDYIVIAIENRITAAAIKKELCDTLAISSDTIVWKDSLTNENTQEPVVGSKLPGGPSSDDEILISILLGDGFGDAIISKKFIGVLGNIAGNECRIDIYASDIVCEFVKKLFEDEQSVKNIYPQSKYNFSSYRSAYDLAISPAYIISIAYYNLERLRRKNPHLADIVVKMDHYLKKEGLSAQHPIDNAILYGRAEKRGWNAYTVQSCGGILPISNSHVKIPLMECNNKGLSVGKEDLYITINYGWGKNQHDTEYVPPKIWPFEYYNQLVAMIKEKSPHIKIVQIGINNTPKLSLVDKFVFNMDIETVKYVLHGSILHIDSEGGMVHLATQLGTKCLVAFGPTPVHFFGYDTNINVVSPKCSNCYYLDSDYSKCIRGLQFPECMYSITPEMMFKEFENYMAERDS